MPEKRKRMKRTPVKEDEIHIDYDEDSHSDEDEPLDILAKRKLEKSKEIKSNCPSLQADDVESDDSLRDPDYEPSDDEVSDEHIRSCAEQGCSDDIFAACINVNCQGLLCYDHFIENSECTIHTRNVSQEPSAAALSPDSFEVEGAPRINITISTPEKPKSNRVICKENRNKGIAYISKHSGKKIPARRVLKSKCQSNHDNKHLHCEDFSEEERQSILDSYYDLANLQKQREWLSRHLVEQTPTNARSHQSRKQKTINYFLPKDGTMRRVCRIMFLHTAGISERQVRTALAKKDDMGILGEEQRGGRRKSQIARDNLLREQIRNHINRFPRMESHYCRSTSKHEYLSPDLTIRKMYELFVKERNTSQNIPSFGMYYKVFTTMNLKFHVPKKDLCGLCAMYNQANEEGKLKLKARYEAHIAAKTKVRKIKDGAKDKAGKNTKFVAATFDLQQVIYLPKSNRTEIFYKRRLGCYNFTVFELETKAGHCFLWHEGIAKRGSNEVCSYVHEYLRKLDSREVSEVALFADGCAGQNKNSIMPAMLLHTVNNSSHITKITMYYFETNHGQSEGDSMHSTVERTLKRCGDVFVPAQLSTVIRLARKAPHAPYSVRDITMKDVKDWKNLSLEYGILRNRVAEDGVTIDWTKVMQLRLEKDKPTTIGFKLSHNTDEAMHLLSVCPGRSQPKALKQKPKNAYRTAPKVSKEKYADLQALSSGETPVIANTDYQEFYHNLPH